MIHITLADLAVVICQSRPFDCYRIRSFRGVAWTGCYSTDTYAKCRIGLKRGLTTMSKSSGSESAVHRKRRAARLCNCVLRLTVLATLCGIPIVSVAITAFVLVAVQQFQEVFRADLETNWRWLELVPIALLWGILIELATDALLRRPPPRAPFVARRSRLRFWIRRTLGILAQFSVLGAMFVAAEFAQILTLCRREFSTT